MKSPFSPFPPVHPFRAFLCLFAAIVKTLFPSFPSVQSFRVLSRCLAGNPLRVFLRLFAAPFPTVLTLFSLLTLSTSCTLRPLHGGHALTTAPHGLTQSLAQSDNPSQPSTQEQETIRTRTYLVPDTNFVLTSQLSPRTLLVQDRQETHARTSLGAAQKDAARDLAAKLSSLKGIVWVGVALFSFGIASAFWPPLKLVIGSVTTSAAISLGGLALIVLPTMIVGNELLILGIIMAITAAWFLAHRHGHLRGHLTALEKLHPILKK